jgi:predicted Fe-Mo cluster-binding NifX family protein
MRVAVSSAGSSLDALAGIPFGTCSQFLVVDSETMEYVVLSVPPGQQDPSTVSLFVIRAIARQGAQIVITGQVKNTCRQAMQSLGMEVISDVGRITVRRAVELYAQGGREAIRKYAPLPDRIAVASHGVSLDAVMSARGEACTSFVLVDPATMNFEVVEVEPAATEPQAGVNAVRAAARAGATAVITTAIRPECCAALQALAIPVSIAEEGLTVRQVIERYRQGKLPSAPSVFGSSES